MLILGATVTVLLIVSASLSVAYVRAGVGFAAKTVASAVFVGGHDLDEIADRGELNAVSIIDLNVDRDQKRVFASFGPIRRTAVFREGLGTALVIDRQEDKVRGMTAPAAPGDRKDDPRPWPVGDIITDDPSSDGVDTAMLAAVLDEAFAEPYTNVKWKRGTRAVVIVKDDRLVAERYAQGFSRHTALTGWSLTKSVICALVGILVAEGKLRIEDSAGLSEWGKHNDPRGAITLDQLLRMSSGLRFKEHHGPGVIGTVFADTAKMIFASGDAARYAANKPLEFEPNTRWQYSSGTTNIVSLILRRAMNDDDAYLALPRRALFDRIGMRHAVMETDASGTFLGSSFGWASARDWARFGLLFLNDGVWLGERLLPDGWVDYCRRPTHIAPRGCYGAHWWCNAGSLDDPDDRPMPRLPTDYYYSHGFEGQSVNIFPSRRLVVVRLGLTNPEEAFDREDFLAKVLHCMGP